MSLAETPPWLVRARTHVGWVEAPGGTHHGSLVRASMAGTGLGEGYPWCAAFVGMCLFEGDVLRAHAWSPDHYRSGVDGSPVGWRPAVWQVCRDARATGALRMPEGAGWAPGDLLVFGRNGQSPLVEGGLGHITIVDRLGEDEDGAEATGPVGGTGQADATDGAVTYTIGGDEAGQNGIGVRRTRRVVGAPTPEPIVAWIQLSAPDPSA